MAAVPAGIGAVPLRPREVAGPDVTGELYERYRRQIFFFCLSRLRNRHDAEDAVQTTFLNAFRAIQRGASPAFEAAWLYKIALNVCLSRQRSAIRRHRVETPSDLDALQHEPAAPAADRDALIDLGDTLAEIPEQQRRVLVLREWHGLTYDEIATELGISQSSVEALLFRARRSLARKLEKPKRVREPRKRLRPWGDASSVLAALKGLFAGGGAKVVATLAVIASASAVADVAHYAPTHPTPAPAGPVKLTRMTRESRPAAAATRTIVHGHVTARIERRSDAASARQGLKPASPATPTPQPRTTFRTRPDVHTPPPAPVPVTPPAAPAAPPATQPAVSPPSLPATATVTAPVTDVPTVGAGSRAPVVTPQAVTDIAENTVSVAQSLPATVEAASQQVSDAASPATTATPLPALPAG